MRTIHLPAPVALLPWGLLLTVIALTSFGLLILYSAAGGAMTWALPQGVRFIIFLGMAIAMSWFSPQFYKEWTFLGYAATLLLLILVEAMGAIGGGAQRWLDLGIIRLQPSELMKPAVVLAVARFYDMLPAREIRTWTALWPALLMIGFPAFLVLLQPIWHGISVAVGGVTVISWPACRGGFLRRRLTAAAIIPAAYAFLLLTISGGG